MAQLSKRRPFARFTEEVRHAIWTRVPPPSQHKGLQFRTSRIRAAHNVIGKKQSLAPLLREMEKLKVLGKVIVDLGSSYRYGIGKQGIRDRTYYPTKGKKIVRVDVGFEKSERVSSNTFHVRADIENTQNDSFDQRRKIVQAARFLGANPRNRQPVADLILASDILNYVDYQEVIRTYKKYLKKGGRIVIYNKPNYGYTNLFSENRVKSNNDLVQFLIQNGFEIEHMTNGSHHFNGAYYEQTPVDDTACIMLTARKIK